MYNNPNECPLCWSENIDHFVNDENIWHCHSCSGMWEMCDDAEQFVFDNLYPEEGVVIHKEPMEGYNLT